MLSYIVDENSDVIQNPQLLKALRKILKQKNELLSIDTLDLLVHNSHFHPNEEDLRTFWRDMQGLFEIILVEPEESSGAE